LTSIRSVELIEYIRQQDSPFSRHENMKKLRRMWYYRFRVSHDRVITKIDQMASTVRIEFIVVGWLFLGATAEKPGGYNLRACCMVAYEAIKAPIKVKYWDSYACSCKLASRARYYWEFDSILYIIKATDLTTLEPLTYSIHRPISCFMAFVCNWSFLSVPRYLDARGGFNGMERLSFEVIVSD